MKTAVIYWSATGNTEALARAAAEGAGVTAQTVSEFSDDVSSYDALVLGCHELLVEEFIQLRHAQRLLVGLTHPWRSKQCANL